MENVTLGQIAEVFAFFAALIASCGVIYHFIKKALNKLFAEQLEAINKRVDTIDLNACKNYLVMFLSNVERGEKIDEIELERFYEQYEYYTNHKGNSYIKHKVEKLKQEGKL